MRVTILNRIKHGQRIEKPKIKVTTVKPESWDPNSNDKFAEAAIAWRKRLV